MPRDNETMCVCVCLHARIQIETDRAGHSFKLLEVDSIVLLLLFSPSSLSNCALACVVSVLHVVSVRLACCYSCMLFRVLRLHVVSARLACCWSCMLSSVSQLHAVSVSLAHMLPGTQNIKQSGHGSGQTTSWGQPQVWDNHKA